MGASRSSAMARAADRFRSPGRIAGRWRVAGLAVALSLIVAIPVFAQNDSVREVVRRELDVTEQSIERAREHLAEVHCTAGDRLLENAQELQRRGQAEFLSNTRSGNRQALLLTRQAREFVTKAVQSCQVDVRAQDTIEKLFESVDELILEARERGGLADNPESARLLEAGITQLEKAREAYRAEEFRRAVRLGTVARNLVQRALRGTGPAADQDLLQGQADAALARTDDVLGDARAALAGGATAEARALLDQAERQQTRARDLLHEGHAALAMRATELARTGAVEAMWLDRRAPQRAHVERAIEVVEDMILELGAEVRASGDSDAVALVEKAAEQVQSARRFLAEEQPVAAGRAVHLASSLLRRAAELSGAR